MAYDPNNPFGDQREELTPEQIAFNNLYGGGSAAIATGNIGLRQPRPSVATPDLINRDTGNGDAGTLQPFPTGLDPTGRGPTTPRELSPATARERSGAQQQSRLRSPGGPPEGSNDGPAPSMTPSRPSAPTPVSSQPGAPQQAASLPVFEPMPPPASLQDMVQLHAPQVAMKAPWSSQSQRYGQGPDSRLFGTAGGLLEGGLGVPNMEHGAGDISELLRQLIAQGGGG